MSLMIEGGCLLSARRAAAIAAASPATGRSRAAAVAAGKIAARRPSIEFQHRNSENTIIGNIAVVALSRARGGGEGPKRYGEFLPPSSGKILADLRHEAYPAGPSSG